MYTTETFVTQDHRMVQVTSLTADSGATAHDILKEYVRELKDTHIFDAAFDKAMEHGLVYGNNGYDLTITIILQELNIPVADVFERLRSRGIVIPAK